MNPFRRWRERRGERFAFDETYDESWPYGAGRTVDPGLWEYGVRSGWWLEPAEPAPTGAQVVAMIERYNAALRGASQEPKGRSE